MGHWVSGYGFGMLLRNLTAGSWDRSWMAHGAALAHLRWVSLLRVTGQAGGAGCAGLRADANSAVVVVTAAWLFPARLTA